MKTKIVPAALALATALNAANAAALSIERNPYYVDMPLTAHYADSTCQLWGKVSSKQSYDQVTFNFVNHTNGYRVISWLDFDGYVQEYATLAPGRSIEISTYDGHPWLIQDGRGDCLEVIPNGGHMAYAEPPKPRDHDGYAKSYKVSGTGKYGGYLNLRTGPGVHYGKITHLPEGYRVEVLKTSGGWGKVKLPNGQKGWVSMKFLAAG